MENVAPLLTESGSERPNGLIEKTSFRCDSNAPTHSSEPGKSSPVLTFTVKLVRWLARLWLAAFTIDLVCLDLLLNSL